jgi:hypothetical protein
VLAYLWATKQPARLTPSPISSQSNGRRTKSATGEPLCGFRAQAIMTEQYMNSAPQRTGLRSWLAEPAGRPARLLLGLAACFASPACSDAHNELFESTRASLAGELGDACGEVLPVVASEVEVDDDVTECGVGVCLRNEAVAQGSDESPGMCSCRCAGPAGTGPFCACDSGFSCEHQIEDVGLGNRALAGSYCVPSD